MFQIQWLRRWVRRNTKPIPVNRAALWKNRLSLLYMVAAWNAFGFVIYMCCTGKKDWMEAYGFKSDMDKTISPARQWAVTLDIPKAKVIRVSGLSAEVSELDNTEALLEEGRNK